MANNLSQQQDIAHLQGFQEQVALPRQIQHRQNPKAECSYEQFLYRYRFDKDTGRCLLDIMDGELQCLPRNVGQSHVPPMR